MNTKSHEWGLWFQALNPPGGIHRLVIRTVLPKANFLALTIGVHSCRFVVEVNHYI